MQTLWLGLRMMGYALLGVCAILGIIFVLMKLVERATRRGRAEAGDGPTDPPEDDEQS